MESREKSTFVSLLSTLHSPLSTLYLKNMTFEQQQTTADMQITLPELLQKMTDMGGSDLHLTTNSPPQVRVHGHLAPLAGYVSFTSGETKRLAYSVLTDAQKHRFEENLELDFSFGLKGMSRFRANLFNQKGAVGAVFGAFLTKLKRFKALECQKSIWIWAKSRRV